MKHIQTFHFEITSTLHEGPRDDGVDVEQLSKDIKLRIQQWCDSQGFEASCNLTSHDNEYTPEETAESEAECEREFAEVQKWEDARDAALKADPNFTFDGNMKGAYFYRDADGNDNNMDFTGPILYRTRHKDGTFKTYTVKGKVKFTDNNDYVSAVFDDPTFLDLIQVFELMIRFTGDEHHIFYEGLVLKGVCNGVSVYKLCTGS